MKKILLLVLVVIAPFVAAHDVELTFEPPLVWSDGSEVASGEIANYIATYDCDGQTGSMNSGSTSPVLTDLPDGNCIFTVTPVDHLGVPGNPATLSATLGRILGPVRNLQIGLRHSETGEWTIIVSSPQ